MTDQDKTKEQLLQELAEMRQRVAALEALGTERQPAQESLVRLTALRESEARNQALLGALPDLMFLLSSDGVFLDYHAADPHLLYVPPEQFLGRSVREVLPPEISEALLPLYRKVLETGQPQRLEYSLQMGGDIRHFESRHILCEGQRILSIIRDVTDLQRSEEALRKSEERYRRLVELSPDAIAVHQEGRIVFANTACARLIGAAAPQELLGKSALEFVHPDYREAVMERIRQVLQEERAAPWIEEKFLRLDGSMVDVEVAAIPTTYQGQPAVQAMVRNLTERKRAAEALRASEERYRLLVDHAHEAIVVAQDGLLKFFNPQALEMFGRSAEETAVIPFVELIHPEDQEMVVERYLRRLKGEEPPSVYDFRIVDMAGNIHWVQLGSVRILWEGRPATLNLLTDITERKRAEETLRAREQAERHFLEQLTALHEVTMELAQADSLDHLCRRAVELGRRRLGFDRLGVWFTSERPDTIRGSFGVDEQGEIRDERGQRIPVTAGSAVGQVLARQFRYHLTRDTALRNERGHAVGRGDQAIAALWDGEQIIGCLAADNLLQRQPITEAQGELLALYAAALGHLCTRQRAEESLRASESRFRELADLLPQTVFETDAQGNFTYANRHGFESTGYTPADLERGVHVLQMMATDERERAQRNFLRTLRGEEVDDHEYTFLRKDGSTYPALVYGSPILREGQPVGVRGVVLDLSELRRQEEERVRLITAIEQADETIVITDVEGTIQYVNPAFERITGYSRGEALGQNPRILQSGQHDPAFYRHLWDTLRRGETWTGQFVNKRKDGTLYHEEAVISPVRDASGQVVNYVAVKRDVTREQVLEAQFRQVQKMEAIGRLAGGVAHDFNNLLTAIIGYADLQLLRLGPDDPLRPSVEGIKDAGDRAAALTHQLLAFSRKQILQPQVLDLNAVVAHIEKMLRRLIGEDIELVAVLDPGLGRVKVDPAQMDQVILNLAVNARDAMPQGGKLTLETKNVDLDEDYARQHLGAQPGPYVLLAASDTGVGMDAETQSHLFEPFFTTKEAGKGTGLGLATVYGIVKQSGGYVGVYSEVGHGTTFKIYLPRLEEAAGAGPPAAGTAELRRGRETLLLVEDADLLRGLAREVLERAGYMVLEARNGAEALQVHQQHEGPIHLLLTDVVMPGMNGRELAEQLAPLEPEMKVLYMSGYTDDTIVQHGVLEPGVAFLQKPFSPAALTRKVREVLEAAQGGI